MEADTLVCRSTRIRSPSSPPPPAFFPLDGFAVLYHVHQVDRGDFKLWGQQHVNFLCELSHGKVLSCCLKGHLGLSADFWHTRCPLPVLFNHRQLKVGHMLIFLSMSLEPIVLVHNHSLLIVSLVELNTGSRYQGWTWGMERFNNSPEVLCSLPTKVCWQSINENEFSKLDCKWPNYKRKSHWTHY